MLTQQFEKVGGVDGEVLVARVRGRGGDGVARRMIQIILFIGFKYEGVIQRSEPLVLILCYVLVQFVWWIYWRLWVWGDLVWRVLQSLNWWII